MDKFLALTNLGDFISFSCLITLGIISSTMFNISGQREENIIGILLGISLVTSEAEYFTICLLSIFIYFFCTFLFGNFLLECSFLLIGNSFLYIRSVNSLSYLL